MGNALGCIPNEEYKSGIGSRSKRSSRSQRKMSAEENLLQRQALAMAIQQRHLSQTFDGSISRRIGSTSSRKQTPSSSFRKQIPIVTDNLETKKIVLIHGEGFGAWCWYKVIPTLEEAGLHPVALNLTGSGTDNTDINQIMTMEDYAKPLIDYLHNLPDDEKVILVGHSCGGASVSYALEHCARRVAKAVFISATMIIDGQRPFDVFADELASAEVFMQESQMLLYANGKDQPPTGLVFDKEQLKGMYFNQSPSKDVALAAVSMRPIPLAPIMEKLSLTAENYGTVHRYFIQTLDDRMLSADMQEKLVRENPPHRVFNIKGSDHCPFFSKPQSLVKILLEILQLT